MGLSLKVIIPAALCISILAFFGYKYVNPAPPNHLVITTGDDEGDYQSYAKLYKDILKEDGVTLEIRPSSGAMENYKRLKDDKSDVDVGFIQDGLGSTDEAPDLSSLGSLYYEPVWIFYRAQGKVVTRFSELTGRKIAVGQEGGGTQSLALHLLSASGVTAKNSQLKSVSWLDAYAALKNGSVDAAFFLATPDEPLIKQMVADKTLHLMSVDQAEAITRQIPYLHHLVLPHGSIDLNQNLPAQDVDLVSPTATLVVRDSLHPALAYLLLKAASQVHGEPGIFERKNEFPIDKDYQFPLSDEAKAYYKSGAPFWQRYLPFWLATLIERFIVFIIPMLVFVIPILKLFPRFAAWRIKSKIYHRYGELKFLETQVELDTSHKKDAKYLEELDRIEARVHAMKVPKEYHEQLYGLRGHIDFVRSRLIKTV